MSATLIYGELDLNDGITYSLMREGFKYPPAENQQAFSNSPLVQGQKPSDNWKPNNRELSFSIFVDATDALTLNVALNALYAAAYAAESIVTWCPSGSTGVVYFKAYRAPKIDPASYFRTEYRATNQAIVSWSCQGAPYAHLDRVTLPLTKGLGLDDSFVKRSGVDFENWYEAASGGTITANTTDYLEGGVSCKMTTTDGAHTCLITDESFLVVNPLHAHNAKLFAYKNSGTLSLDYDLHCYGPSRIIKDTIHDLPATIAGTPAFSAFLGEQAPIITAGITNYLSAENSGFETGMGYWVGWYGTCSVAQSAAWASSGTKSLEITPISSTVACCEVANVTSPGKPYKIECKFKGVAGKTYWLAAWDDIVGWDGSSVSTCMGDGTTQTLRTNVIFDPASTDRQIFFNSNATDPADVSYVDDVTVVDGPAHITWPSASLGIIPGMPISIVCVVKNTTGNDGLHHLMCMTGNPGGNGFELIASGIYGQICIVDWSAGNTKSTGMIIDSTNWAPDVTHVIIATMDADNNQRLFVDGVEGTYTIGSCAREVSVGTDVILGTHTDNEYPIDGVELSAIFNGIITDAEVADISAMTDWATLPDLTAATPLLLFDSTEDAIDENILLGTLSLLYAYNPAATTWMDVLKVAGEPVVYPSDSGLSPCFPAGTTKVKREIRHDTTVGVVSLDSLYFGDTEYVIGHELEGSMAICVPPGECPGHVPARARLHVGSTFSSGPWSLQNSGLGAWWLEGIAAVDASHVWAVGEHGKLSFYNGLTWTPQASGVIRTLRAVSAYDSTHVWAVGDYGTVLYWNGATWADQTFSFAYLYGVCAIAANNVIAVGEEGHIYKYVSSWTLVNYGGYALRAVDAADASHIWAVGDHGTMLFSSNGTTWTLLANRTTVNLRAVCALDSTHVWTVGESGRILFYDGTNWVRQTSPTSQHLLGVYAYDSTHVWAVGTSGTILFYNGIVWAVQGSGTSQHLRQVSGVSATSVWAVGDYGTIIHGVDSVGAMPMTNLIVGQRDTYAENWSPVQDAVGTTQTLSYLRRGQYYRAMAASATNKFRFPVGSHRGRYVISLGITWGASTAYDKVTIDCYLEASDGTRLTATTVSLPVLDMGDPNTKWKEVAFATSGTRLIDVSLPTHYVPQGTNEDNIYQVFEVKASSLLAATYQWIDCMTLIPVDKCVELSSLSNNFVILDSEGRANLVSQDGSLDTATMYDPTKMLDSPRFEADPAGMNLVVLAGNIVSGDERLTPKLDIVMTFEPLVWMTP